MVYVLEGAVTAHLGENIFSLKVGDSIAFPPGVENMHFIQNDAEVTASVLVVARNVPLDEVIYG